ncbi:hypothetical protein BU17DRAFT_94016 [Hysterangium stoloniferum]|nr:hypothetical protein BU17DRAFT_94016 [Hysterangium stoloniferum]
MPWGATILEQFQLVNRYTTDESEYYGPYITLLTDLFPHTDHYQVAPQFKGPATPGSLDFVYVVMKRKVPVLFIEVKPYVYLQDMAKREKADNQMRGRFRELGSPSLPMPKLYGISAMGTCFSVYEYAKETNRVSPPLIPRDRDVVNDVAPQERWKYELLEVGGEAKFRSLVAELKAMAQGIGNYSVVTFVFPMVGSGRLSIWTKVVSP